MDLPFPHEGIAYNYTDANLDAFSLSLDVSSFDVLSEFFSRNSCPPSVDGLPALLKSFINQGKRTAF